MAKLDYVNYKGTIAEIVPEIAPLFKTTETYAAGDHVIYEADWYTFKEAKEAGAWDATKVDGPFKVADEIVSLKEDLNENVFDKQLLLNPSTLSANNNTALVNNNDGTYTIGTTDFGNSTFGSKLTLEAGVYYLYGVPNGIAFVSPDGAASSSYNNRIAENSSNKLKKFVLEETQELWVCFRSPAQPAETYTITPGLYRKQAIEYDALKFMGVLANGTDLNTITERGIYFVSSDRTYTNAPLSSGFFIVLTTVTAVQQIFIQYGSALTYTGAVYKRDGGTSGVTTSWKRYGALNDHNIVFFGDSIMWGRDGSVSALTRSVWQIPHSVSWILGYRTVNYGVAGQAFLPTTDSPATAYDNIASKNLSAYDTLVMCYGIGDGFHILGEWDSTDETTVMGQFNKIINYIYTQNPTMRIIVIAPWNGRNIGTYPDYWYGDRDRSPYVSRKVLSDTLKRACDYYWIPYIEQYDGPITPNTITTLLPDGTHPNDDGYKMIGEWVAKKIGGLL